MSYFVQRTKLEKMCYRWNHLAELSLLLRQDEEETTVKCHCTRAFIG